MSAHPREPLFERLKQGLEEGIAHARGEITLRTVVMPEEPPEIDAETLVSLRNQSAMSQAVFARMLNVSPRTVQSCTENRCRFTKIGVASCFPG